MTAAEQLTHALLDLADQGRATPCQGRRRDRWTSDDATDRAWAASVCSTLGCPVLEQCAAAADEQGERHHVWGGRDHTSPQAQRATGLGPEFPPKHGDHGDGDERRGHTGRRGRVATTEMGRRRPVLLVSNFGSTSPAPRHLPPVCVSPSFDRREV